MLKKKIRVLIVEDSMVIQKFLRHAIESSSDLEVVGTATDPYEARDLLVELKPDVVTLDINLPKMDGLTFLERIMNHLPTRVVMISSLTSSGSQTALRALELGAVEVIEKPSIEIMKDPNILNSELLDKIRTAASARLPAKGPAVIGPQSSVKSIADSNTIIAIASSTGGTEALKVVLGAMPANIPPTVIVQHMPPGFTKAYADNLNKRFPFEVKEAEHGDRLMAGRVLIAPGNFHMEIRRSGSLFTVVLHQDVPLHSVRPAADYLMKSVAKYAKDKAVGVVLTGMGKDGAKGLLEMRQAGAQTYAQSEKTCVVYGMPAAAVQLGAVNQVEDVQKIGSAILEGLAKKVAA